VPKRSRATLSPRASAACLEYSALAIEGASTGRRLIWYLANVSTLQDPIRLAVGEDAPRVLEIYAPIVRETIISFELAAPTGQEMRDRIVSTLEALPWLVYERDAALLGYAYATRHRERLAYQWSVDVSCYVHAEARRGGIGKALYGALFGILRAQGFQNAYAGITLPNEASVRLHEAMGFKPVGVYRGVGYKLGAWRDVGWWHCSLGAAPDEPRAPRSLREALAPSALSDARK